MATRRKSTKGKSGDGAPVRRKRGRGKASAAGGHRSGARHTRAVQASRSVRADDGRRADEAPGWQPGGPPALRLAEPVAAEGTKTERDREAAELARRIEATVGAASESLRSGPASAAEQLREHRAQMEEAARRHEEARGLPGPATLGLELAVGALRLVRSMATAPLRIGLALLRR